MTLDGLDDAIPDSHRRSGNQLLGRSLARLGFWIERLARGDSGGSVERLWHCRA
jgi:hypothetical protein